jgi:hypothetical protein
LQSWFLRVKSIMKIGGSLKLVVVGLIVFAFQGLVVVTNGLETDSDESGGEEVASSRGGGDESEVAGSDDGGDEAGHDSDYVDVPAAVAKGKGGKGGKGVVAKATGGKGSVAIGKGGRRERVVAAAPAESGDEGADDEHNATVPDFKCALIGRARRVNMALPDFCSPSGTSRSLASEYSLLKSKLGGEHVNSHGLIKQSWLRGLEHSGSLFLPLAQREAADRVFDTREIAGELRVEAEILRRRDVFVSRTMKSLSVARAVAERAWEEVAPIIQRRLQAELVRDMLELRARTEAALKYYFAANDTAAYEGGQGSKRRRDDREGGGGGGGGGSGGGRRGSLTV